jgi:hypothetical protein
LAVVAAGCGKAPTAKAMPSSSLEPNGAMALLSEGSTVLRRVFNRRDAAARVAFDDGAWERELGALDAFGEVGRKGTLGREWHFDRCDEAHGLSLDRVEFADGQVLVVAREVQR